MTGHRAKAQDTSGLFLELINECNASRTVIGNGRSHRIWVNGQGGQNLDIRARRTFLEWALENGSRHFVSAGVRRNQKKQCSRVHCVFVSCIFARASREMMRHGSAPIFRIAILLGPRVSFQRGKGHRRWKAWRESFPGFLQRCGVWREPFLPVSLLLLP